MVGDKDEPQDTAPDPRIWKQVSRKYRLVARLPEGMSGREALRWGMEEYHKLYREGAVPKHEIEWIEGLADSTAAEQFRRVFTIYRFARHLLRVLTPRAFDEFKRLSTAR